MAIITLRATAEKELIATEFAMALLMPEKQYKEQIAIHTDPHGRVDTKAIADHFHVPIDVAHMRGVSLGTLRQF